MSLVKRIHHLAEVRRGLKSSTVRDQEKIGLAIEDFSTGVEVRMRKTLLYDMLIF